jgi:hypothetical protein
MAVIEPEMRPAEEGDTVFAQASLKDLASRSLHTLPIKLKV